MYNEMPPPARRATDAVPTWRRILSAMLVVFYATILATSLADYQLGWWANTVIGCYVVIGGVDAFFFHWWPMTVTRLGLGMLWGGVAMYNASGNLQVLMASAMMAACVAIFVWLVRRNQPRDQVEA